MEGAVTRRCAIVPFAVVLGLAACADRRVEEARMACTVVMQALYTPGPEDAPATFEAVANVSSDAEKFEFVWKQSQVKNLIFSLSLADIVGSERLPTESYSVIVERAGAERQYLCRGSLSVRSLHGIWVRQTSASGTTKDIKVTKYPVSF